MLVQYRALKECEKWESEIHVPCENVGPISGERGQDKGNGALKSGKGFGYGQGKAEENSDQGPFGKRKIQDAVLGFLAERSEKEP